ncbi:hypothetical protein DFP72DRAFT_1064314 [Ephemerocybe angulata]|uniref:Uncharacterized protein n=1 Tax=Ephemerocybe angulata TaxID=980116 RepID=A0A8H6MB87_9AGAR|nr:hypothetical protein DFP72DRAFT_1064314 [Tulosesus angulatus]
MEVGGNGSGNESAGSAGSTRSRGSAGSGGSQRVPGKSILKNASPLPSPVRSTFGSSVPSTPDGKFDVRSKRHSYSGTPRSSKEREAMKEMEKRRERQESEVVMVNTLMNMNIGSKDKTRRSRNGGSPKNGSAPSPLNSPRTIDLGGKKKGLCGDDYFGPCSGKEEDDDEDGLFPLPRASPGGSPNGTPGTGNTPRASAHTTPRGSNTPTPRGGSPRVSPRPSPRVSPRGSPPSPLSVVPPIKGEVLAVQGEVEGEVIKGSITRHVRTASEPMSLRGHEFPRAPPVKESKSSASVASSPARPRPKPQRKTSNSFSAIGRNLRALKGGFYSSQAGIEASSGGRNYSTTLHMLKSSMKTTIPNPPSPPPPESASNINDKSPFSGPSNITISSLPGLRMHLRLEPLSPLTAPFSKGPKGSSATTPKLDVKEPEFGGTTVFDIGGDAGKRISHHHASSTSRNPNSAERQHLASGIDAEKIREERNKSPVSRTSKIEFSSLREDSGGWTQPRTAGRHVYQPDTSVHPSKQATASIPFPGLPKITISILGAKRRQWRLMAMRYPGDNETSQSGFGWEQDKAGWDPRSTSRYLGPPAPTLSALSSSPLPVLLVVVADSDKRSPIAAIMSATTICLAARPSSLSILQPPTAHDACTLDQRLAIRPSSG